MCDGGFGPYATSRTRICEKTRIAPAQPNAGTPYVVLSMNEAWFPTEPGLFRWGHAPAHSQRREATVASRAAGGDSSEVKFASVDGRAVHVEVFRAHHPSLLRPALPPSRRTAWRTSCCINRARFFGRTCGGQTENQVAAHCSKNSLRSEPYRTPSAAMPSASALAAPSPGHPLRTSHPVSIHRPTSSAISTAR